MFLMETTDKFVVIYFALEVAIRLVVSPRKLHFLRQPMNVIDILAVLPFFVSLLLEGLEDFALIGKTGKVIRLVRLMRVLRLFKLVRHFAGLQSLLITLQHAYQELGLLGILILVAVLTYSSLLYFAEREVKENKSMECAHLTNNSSFGNITVMDGGSCYSWTFIEAFWWGLMTITTVGYDVQPTTVMGKLIGGFCAMTGIFILTLPIPIVVNSFATFYNNRMWRTEVEQRKRERTLQINEELRKGQYRSKFF